MIGAALLAACTATSRVPDDLVMSQLGRDNRAVVLMKIGSADPACQRASVMIGVHEGGTYYRPLRQLDVVGLIAPSTTAVSEIELERGTYHVIGYSCADAKGKRVTMSSKVDYSYRASLASFEVAAGEVLNVGHLQIHAGRVRRNLLSRSVPLSVEVSDWPLAEIERFRDQRPHLFAAMRTRLMVVTPSTMTPDQHGAMCAELAKLQTSGKVQSLPASCRTGIPNAPIDRASLVATQ
ncbi:MAG: hypothetical protein ACOYLQ_10195 [Hyphomicrobiaceae bacterium]